MRFIHLWRFLSVAAWLALVAVGVWSFFSLSDLGEFRTDGTPRTVLDKAVPYLFLLLIPFGAWMARKEFVEARNAIPIADAHAEELRQRRQRQKETQAELVNRPPLADDIKRDALATVALLKTAGVISSAEVDETAFLDLCQVYYLENGDIYEVSSILALYAEAHSDLDNALLIPDQVEVAAPDTTAIIKGFARLAGRSKDIADVTVNFSNNRKRGSDGEARFTLAGVPQTIPFEHHSKNASGSLMDGLAAAFNPTPPYALAYFDSIYLLTCLADQERAALNAALDPEYETFVPLVPEPT